MYNRQINIPRAWPVDVKRILLASPQKGIAASLSAEGEVPWGDIRILQSWNKINFEDPDANNDTPMGD